MSHTSVETGSLQITSELVESLVVSGGYVHPLFDPPADDPGPRPLPGQAVLLLMGGLVEQSGVLDHAVALLELRSVRFIEMVTAGTTLRVRVGTGPRTPTSRADRWLQHLQWTAVDEAGVTLVDADVLMLVRAEEQLS